MNTVTMPAAVIYRQQVMHQRMFPVRYRFRYRLFALLVDIDRLADFADSRRFLSFNRFNLFSLHTRDHGRRDGSPWRTWIEARLAEHGIQLAGGRIRLLTMPRVLGYNFNPLSIWYCEHEDGSHRAVLLEVRNTFGEHHHYLLHADGQPLTWPVQAAKPKQFHVSPFMPMAAHYRFRLYPPGKRLRVSIHQFQDDTLALIASQAGHAEACTDSRLLRLFLAQPWVAVKTMLLIHWQALWIWARGAPYFRKPKPPAQEIT